MKQNTLKKLKKEELNNVSGAGFDGGALIAAVAGGAAVAAGLATGQPWAIVAGCMAVGYNAKNIAK